MLSVTHWSAVNPSDDIGIHAGFMIKGFWNPSPVSGRRSAGFQSSARLCGSGVNVILDRSTKKLQSSLCACVFHDSVCTKKLNQSKISDDSCYWSIIDQLSERSTNGLDSNANESQKVLFLISQVYRSESLSSGWGASLYRDLLKTVGFDE